MCEILGVIMLTTCIMSFIVSKYLSCYLISLGLTPAYDIILYITIVPI